MYRVGCSTLLNPIQFRAIFPATVREKSDGSRFNYVLSRGLILGPKKPPDMMKYRPFRQWASMSRQNRSASAVSAVKDDVIGHSDALRVAPDTPDGASLVSLYLAPPFMCQR